LSFQLVVVRTFGFLLTFSLGFFDDWVLTSGELGGFMVAGGRDKCGDFGEGD